MAQNRGNGPRADAAENFLQRWLAEGEKLNSNILWRSG
jgi:hypothetical protein